MMNEEEEKLDNEIEEEKLDNEIEEETPPPPIGICVTETIDTEEKIK